MLLFETPKKVSFDADVLTVAEHMVTKVNVNGSTKSLKKYFVLFTEFSFFLEENLSISNMSCGLSLASLT